MLPRETYSAHLKNFFCCCDIACWVQGAAGKNRALSVEERLPSSPLVTQPFTRQALCLLHATQRMWLEDRWEWLIPFLSTWPIYYHCKRRNTAIIQRMRCALFSFLSYDHNHIRNLARHSIDWACCATPLAVSTLTFPPPFPPAILFFCLNLKKRAKQLTHAWGLHEMCDPGVPSPIWVCTDYKSLRAHSE